MDKAETYLDKLEKRVILITGDYGVGKTTISLNIAMRLAEQKKRAAIADMDTVNPYFRSADHAERLKKLGIDIICPKYAGSNLDIPVLDYDIESLAAAYDTVIIDMGGSEAGAYPVGKYRELFSDMGNDFCMLYVYSMYRHVGRSAEESAAMLREIELACGIRCTALINNSNLGAETSPQTIADSASFAADMERLTGLDTILTCAAEGEEDGENRMTVKRIVTLPWENTF